MEPRHAHLRIVPDVSRRELLKAGLAAGAVLSAWPLYKPTSALGAEAGQPGNSGRSGAP
jgi:hypothetical protein